MTSLSVSRNIDLLTAFKNMLKEKGYRTQSELACDLSRMGFENISLSKISRMLTKIGAIKTRDTENKIIYKLPENLSISKIKFAIDTVVLSVINNGTQIVLKTGPGGGPLISRVLDSLESSFGILGTISGSDTVLIVPCDTNKIDALTNNISVLFRITTH